MFVPKGVRVPRSVAPIVRSLSLTPLANAWDGLVRVAASIRTGWCSGVLALDRFGAASRGDPLHKAGTALGKLLRTLYLCDYFAQEPFRRAINHALSHGESVHSLQRAIYAGAIPVKRGRRPEEQAAISGSLSLLTNIVMAWNTYHLQMVHDRWVQEKHRPVDDAVFAEIGPVAHTHINFRGVFHFPLEAVQARMLVAEGRLKEAPAR
ncbi:MAG: hypothetical protein NVSMB52_16200 [Chloroflexota bacterium]